MHDATYVQGHLDQTFQDRFGGLRIEQQEGGTTLFSRPLPDQAALYGVLLQLIRLGLTLLSAVDERGAGRGGGTRSSMKKGGAKKKVTGLQLV